MAKKVIINTAFWHRQKLNKLNSKDASLVFPYLICNPKVTRTGIYTIFSEEIASGIGRKIIDAEEVRRAITELEEAGLIQYEHDADIVYIINFKQYCCLDSGEPTIIAKELLDDFKEIDRNNKIVLGFWLDYVQENQDQLLLIENRLEKSKNNKKKLTLKPLLDLILPLN